MSKSLEDNFYDLNDLHLQVLEFEDSEEDYLLEIEQEFNDIMKTVQLSLTASESIRKQKEAAPLHKSVERKFRNISNLLDMLDQLCNKEKDLVELSVLREDLDNSISDLLESISKLGLLEDIKNIDSEADELLSRSEITKRKELFYQIGFTWSSW